MGKKRGAGMSTIAATNAGNRETASKTFIGPDIVPGVLLGVGLGLVVGGILLHRRTDSAVPRGTGRGRGPRFHVAGRPGTQVHVHSEGTGPDTYVLIHGIGVSSRYFRPLAKELARTATVHNIELPGHGSTPKPRRTLSVPDYARAVWDALDELGADRPILVGHSMGCQIAVEMVNMRATAAPRLVLLGPTNYPPERGFWLQALRLGQDTLREPWRINAVVLSDYIFRCRPPWYFRTVPAMLSNHIENGMANVQVPVVVVRGIKDPIVPAAWTSALAHLAPQGSMAQIDDESHVMMYRSAAEVAALCRAPASHGSSRPGDARRKSGAAM